MSLLEESSTWILKSPRIRIRSGVKLTVVIINPGNQIFTGWSGGDHGSLDTCIK